MHVLNSTDTDSASLRLPRILCLHGGGTNARIFHAQCRGLRAQLKNEFRLVFAEAPFPSYEPGSDVVAVYGTWGPFRQWLRWRPELQQRPWLPQRMVGDEIDAACEQAMLNDTEVHSATGEWIAIMGFSQGARIAASLLYRQQKRQEERTACFSGSYRGEDDCTALGGTLFRFGVLLAGRGPLVSLEGGLDDELALFKDPSCADVLQTQTSLLQIPTIHVHGLIDPGLEAHQKLYEGSCDRQSRRLVEWKGEHRVPLKKADVALVVEQIRVLAKETASSQDY